MHSLRADPAPVTKPSNSKPGRRCSDNSGSSLAGLPQALRNDVRLIGALLGRVIANDRGTEFVDRIETIRSHAKKARRGSGTEWGELSKYLSALPEDSLVDIARAFNQFLNLANIADQVHTSRQEVAWPQRLTLDRIAGLRVEPVLTAHPTEVLRRTLIQKYDSVAALLDGRSRSLDEERGAIDRDLQRLIAEAWHSDEIRRTRPSPQDEARWGFAVVENSLWQAVPAAMRDLDRAVGQTVPIDIMPFSFCSWMGGDRDGNPSVTAAVTREVLMIARWVSADLFLRDANALVASLSMTAATPALRQFAGDAAEPYRAVLKDLRRRLESTRSWIEQDGPPGPEVLQSDTDLIEPLERCYESLNAKGMQSIACGPLLDTLRRARCFGIHLVRLDIRQHAARHSAVLDNLTRYLSRNDRGFASWSESERCAWLLTELDSRRPLFPAGWPLDPPSREVIDTFRVIAENDAAGISAYVVSMASAPSEVLAVALLLKEAGVHRNIPIVPLFETLADLESAADTVDALLSMPWFRAYVGHRYQVMIGYSDSAKDAGPFAAAWAQYRAQEMLVGVASRHDVALTLFHGRGGAIARGGGPAQQAIQAQPPGSVAGFLRVTEQGEMIRFRLGTPAVAAATLSHYLSATLKATLEPPAAPTQTMRVKMDELAGAAQRSYTTAINDPGFVDFFRVFTPATELAVLALGSRPARRSPAHDIDSLRAIPWVFAWTQVRLMLPAWLGTESALANVAIGPEDFKALRSWPFFAMHIEMLESALLKADPVLARYYSRRLTTSEKRAMANAYVDRLAVLHDRLLALKGTAELLSGSREVRDSIAVRNTCLDPLHLLQAELLVRRRDGNCAPAVDQALKVTMAGIASGLRSTG